jgi:UDP-N-acetylmuramate: L-alanyl-gamma-D-glutamyl-meso-diaminopimelate ligase
MRFFFQVEKIPEGERLNPQDLIENLKKSGKSARYVPVIDDIVSILAGEGHEGDVICFMSNGGFGGIYQKVMDRLPL